jgi:hypothetical protein
MKWLWWVLGALVLLAVAAVAILMWMGKLTIAGLGRKPDAQGKTDPAGTNQVTKRDETAPAVGGPATATKKTLGATLAGKLFTRNASKAALTILLDDAEKTAAQRIAEA